MTSRLFVLFASVVLWYGLTLALFNAHPLCAAWAAARMQPGIPDASDSNHVPLPPSPRFDLLAQRILHQGNNVPVEQQGDSRGSQVIVARVFWGCGRVRGAHRSWSQRWAAQAASPQSHESTAEGLGAECTTNAGFVGRCEPTSLCMGRVVREGGCTGATVCCVPSRVVRGLRTDRHGKMPFVLLTRRTRS